MATKWTDFERDVDDYKQYMFGRSSGEACHECLYESIFTSWVEINSTFEELPHPSHRLMKIGRKSQYRRRAKSIWLMFSHIRGHRCKVFFLLSLNEQFKPCVFKIIEAEQLSLNPTMHYCQNDSSDVTARAKSTEITVCFFYVKRPANRCFDS